MSTHRALVAESVPMDAAHVFEDAQTLRAHLAAIVASSDDAIVSKTLDGIVQSWNRGAERMFGYTAEEMIGLSITTIIPEGRLSEEEFILSKIRRGEHVDHFETVRRRKDGSLIDISVTISPIRDGRGRVVGASKIARDITERKEVDRILLELNEKLERHVSERTAELQAANEEMESFTYSVSHDFRAPLRAIVATSDILLEDVGPKLNPQERELLERQSINGRKMAALIDDLLKLSRVGRQELNIEPFNISDLAQEIARDHDLGAPKLTIEPNMSATADARLVRVILTNLLENAKKFSPNGAPIVFGRAPTTRGEAFFVRDQGIGLDMQYAEKVFKPFERLHLESEYPGTGIGLATAKRATQRHNGEIWVESKGPGTGSTFYFTLPQADVDDS